MQRFTTRLALAAMALALSTSIPRPAAAGGYTITDLGTVPYFANTWDWQQTINDDGVIAAYANISSPLTPMISLGPAPPFFGRTAQKPPCLHCPARQIP